MQLSLSIVVAKEIDGLEMGVLQDGTAYLSSRSLAKLCGVAPSAVINQGSQWKEGKREGKLARILANAGFNGESLYIEIQGPTGPIYAYPDNVCTVFLDYYAFEADKTNDTARANFRKLAQTSLRLMIYGATGYDPGNLIPERWRQYHDRMLLNTSPKGYYSVFREMGEVVLSAIQAGLQVDPKTIPDISVGIAWGKHWQNIEGDEKFGQRTQFPHHYPDYFPQAKAGPDAWVYPLMSLGEFRQWMQQHYLPNVFPNYLAQKVRQGLLPASVRDLVLEAVDIEPPALPA